MKKYIILALAGFLVLSGCSNFLVEKPILSQSTDITLSDFNGLDKAVGGVYSPLASSGWYGSFYVLDAEMRSGNAKRPTISKFTSGRMITPYKLDYDESNTVGLWGTAYYVISACNNVLDNLEGKAVAPVTQQQLDNLKAECLFIRALSHFDLVRTYAHAYSKDAAGMGVPIILHTDKTFKEMPERAAISAVYDQIVLDLINAETAIEATYVRAFDDARASVSKEAIQALLSRVYLYMGKWQESANYATKVITSGKFEMWTAANYTKVWSKDKYSTAKDGEVIFQVYGLKANSYDCWWEGPVYMTLPKGYGDCAASKQLTALYAAGDVRATMFRTDPDNESGGELWTKKYIGKGFANNLNAPDVSNVILFRLSEMYLNRAEALIRGAAIAGATALSDLNVITANRGAAAYASVSEEDVFVERRKELAFEGQYWYDLARTKRALSYVDGVGDKNLAPTAALWALPIPKREIDVNKNLKQNPY